MKYRQQENIPSRDQNPSSICTSLAEFINSTTLDLFLLLFLITLVDQLLVLENVVFDEHSREVDYTEKSVTGKCFPKYNNLIEYSM